MSLKFGLQVLLESYYIFLMKEVTDSVSDKCNFVLIYSRNAFFAPINGPKYEISNNVVCASTKGLDQRISPQTTIPPNHQESIKVRIRGELFFPNLFVIFYDSVTK